MPLLKGIFMPKKILDLPLLQKRTHETAFLWPTKSRLAFHDPRSTIWAVGPPPFIAWAETIIAPSGDQPGLNTWVVPPDSWKGASITCSKLQSDVFHTLIVLSSDWLAKYLPTGSKKTPRKKIREITQQLDFFFTQFLVGCRVALKVLWFHD